jgi:antitoxin component YwqK of YwqJK toxin-antitoxin module
MKGPALNLYIAEIPYDTGELRYRYARHLSSDGSQWIRHGLFTEFHQNGQMASQGTYANDLEEGSWQDFYENGQIAAQGLYRSGIEIGTWQYWNPEGIQEASEDHPAVLAPK